MGGPLSYLSHQVARIALPCPMGLRPSACGFGSAMLIDSPESPDSIISDVSVLLMLTIDTSSCDRCGF
jgi:hypothetical protein